MVAIHDVGLLGDRVFVAMDFVDGVTLRRWVAQPRRPREIVVADVQAGEGLAAAHRAGIVHRDFKPDNALVGKDPQGGVHTVGRVQVLDFGLARVRDPAIVELARDADAHAPATPRGTPMYMAPEQHRGDDAGPACDQFAFCVALFEALWKRLPFAGEDNLAIGRAIVEGRRIEPPRGDVPARVRRAILRGLDTDPRARFPSMEALVTELRATGGRRVRFVAIAAGSAAIGVAAWAYGRSSGRGDDPCADPESAIAALWNDARAGAVEQDHRHRGAHAPRTQIGRAHDSIATERGGLQRGRRRARPPTSATSNPTSSSICAWPASTSVGDDSMRWSVCWARPTVRSQTMRSRPPTPCPAPMAAPTRPPCSCQPLPEDVGARAQIDELRARLAHADALAHAGKPGDALAITELAARRADGLGWCRCAPRPAWRSAPCSRPSVAGRPPSSRCVAPCSPRRPPVTTRC